MKQEIMDLLYRSFDQELRPEEEKILSAALAASPALRQEKAKIVQMRSLLRNETTPSFQPFFAARVMRRIANRESRGEDFFGSLLWSFRFVAAGAALVVGLLMTQNLVGSDNLSMSTLLGIDQPGLEETWELDVVIQESAK